MEKRRGKIFPPIPNHSKSLGIEKSLLCQRQLPLSPKILGFHLVSAAVRLHHTLSTVS